MASKRIVHIGMGRWGQNYLKTFKDLPVTVSVATRETWQALLDAQPDGVTIAIPPDSHVQIATYALDRNIPVMVEKPLSLLRAEAETLKKYSVPILVNHIYLFSNDYQVFKEECRDKNITRIHTVGTGTATHADYSVLWNYGPHDIAMILDLLGRMPNQVSATTADNKLFIIEMDFGNIQTHSTIGIGDSRERTVTAFHPLGEVQFEDSRSTEPSPLHTSIEVFLKAIDGVEDQRLGVELACNVLAVLEACDRSLETNTPMPL